MNYYLKFIDKKLSKGKFFYFNKSIKAFIPFSSYGS